MDIGGIMLKIKLKLLAFIILLAIVPIVTVNVFSSSRINDSSIELHISSTESIIENQADNINFYFDDIIASLKELAASEIVRNYAVSSYEDGFSVSESSEEYVKITEKFESVASANHSLRKIMVINNSGMIIASTDSSDTGKSMSNYKGLFNLALTNNGVSSFFMSGGDDDNVPVFIVAKAIYSSDNVCQGIVYQLFDTTRLQKIVNCTNLDKYTTSALMDSDGNVLEYPYKTVKNYAETDNYRAAASILRTVTDSEALTGFEPVNEYGSGNSERILFVSAVSSCQWSMLAVSDKHSLLKETEQNTSSLYNISIILLILAGIGTIVFIYFFTKPVDEIIRVLLKKQKGDSNSRFNIKSGDEFQVISNSFNSVYDDVYEIEQRYRTIVEITNNVVFELSFATGTVIVSKNFNKKFSYRAKDDSIKESFLYKLRMHKDDRERYLSDLDRILGPANFMQGEYRVKSIYGDFIWIMIKATKFYNRDEVPTKIVGVIMDIDKEKRSEMHLLQRASYDALTQLYNRETFIKSLGVELEASAHKKTLDAMMFIDLDDFKFFNDEYGHACGDDVLKFVADTLKEICFERGFAGRFGGDEFVACFTNLTLYGDSGKLAQEIIDILAKGFTSETTGLKLNIHCSIGIAFLHESGKTTEEVIAAADEAMYNIKKHGKSAYAYAKSPQKQAESTSAPVFDSGYVNDITHLL